MPAASLALASALSLALLAARVVVTGNHVTFVFLVWNLFLAVLPLAFALTLRALVDRRANVVAVGLVAVLWLGFLPNAPYLVSDLVHLRPRPNAPYWLDLTMLASFAVTGLWFGGAATAVVFGVVDRAAGRVTASAVVVAAALLAGVGVHLGRFDRWNSWDLVHSPLAVLRDVVDKAHDAHAVAFAVAFAVLLLAASLGGLRSESATRSTA